MSEPHRYPADMAEAYRYFAEKLSIERAGAVSGRCRSNRHKASPWD